jgi:hypothetical protein
MALIDLAWDVLLALLIPQRDSMSNRVGARPGHPISGSEEIVCGARACWPLPHLRTAAAAGAAIVSIPAVVLSLVDAAARLLAPCCDKRANRHCAHLHAVRQPPKLALMTQLRHRRLLDLPVLERAVYDTFTLPLARAIGRACKRE